MKTRLYLKRTFSASHHLPGYDGPCARLHGHTFIVEVWIEGPVDPETGMIVDFRGIKKLIDTCDHRHLNDLLPVSLLPPTAENLARYFHGRIARSTRVRVWESNDCYAECSEGAV